MTTDLFGTSPAISSSTTAPKHHGRRAGTLGVVATAAITLFIGGMGATASAEPDNGNTVANVNVGEGITLTGLDAAFNLDGFPTDTVTSADAVTYNVVTNSPTGYTVEVQAAAATLTNDGVPALPVNNDSIPIAALTAQDGNNLAVGSGGFLPMSSTDGVPVHSQIVRSGAAGDTLSTDFEMLIPNVAEDTYSVSLNFLAIVQ